MLGKVRILLCIIAISIVLIPFSYAQVLEGFEEDLTYQDHVERNEYDKALKKLKKISEYKLTIPEKKLKINLETFETVEKAKPPDDPLALKQEDIDPKVIKQAKRFYREAQKSILANKPEIARDILIYILYIYPDHHKSKTLLELALELKPGSYKVTDIIKKYMKRSANYFYGGNYILSVKDLQVLAILDKENPLVFERLGSSYYMMNEKNKAINAWATALFLNPENKDLEKIITKTKKVMAEEAKADLVRKSQPQLLKEVIKDPQIMGVFRSQSQAFDMAQDLKKQGLTVNMEEDDKGRWRVIVSRKELIEYNKKKGK